MNLYPCQLFHFWETKILQNCGHNIFKNFFSIILWFFKHPLHKQSNRALLIDKYTRQLKAMYCTLNELNQNDLAEIVCPFPIFLNSFSSMSKLYSADSVLIFFQKTALKSIKQKINCIKSLFQPIQSFKEICYEYDRLKNKDVYWLRSITKDSFTERMIDPFKDLANQPLYAVLHIKSSSIPRSEEYDQVIYDIASKANAHLIHFEQFDFNG